MHGAVPEDDSRLWAARSFDGPHELGFEAG